MEVYFLYYKGECYYDVEDLGRSHSSLAFEFKLPEDKCLKLVYNKDFDYFEYGIQGIRNSVVYKDVGAPITPTKQDLDVIEEFTYRDFVRRDLTELQNFERGLTDVMRNMNTYSTHTDSSEDKQINNLNDWWRTGLLDHLIQLRTYKR